MNKKEFLRTLELSLADFKDEERKDILYDYEEHFRAGLENGKNEQELIEELGDPRSIANQYRLSSQYETKREKDNGKGEERTVATTVIAACALVLFNLIFVIGPYAGIAGVMAGLFAVAGALVISGVAMVFGVILMPLIPQFISIPDGLPGFAMVLFGIGTVALGLLALIGMCYAAKYFWKGTVKYVNWNKKIIKG